ncbi:MAG: formylglycine-generating enzyme family protein [Pirellulales bacterium]|nr:formylglycine-generating enzyme family protein [Pirellulales bacterium]
MSRNPTRGLFSMPAALALAVLFVAGFVAPALAVTIPTVPVGNPGNAPDQLWTQTNPTNLLFGSVGYAYRIGTTEVTVGQYTDFLNAVAATDTYALYNTSMGTDLNIAGIARTGSSGSYTYSVIGSANKPVTNVSWGDAARFSNWLNNGQPTGAQGPGTTETGAYTLNGAVTRAALNAVSRNAGATWFIPSESEWYKAAYYEPAAQGGDADNYWLYPTGTNSEPISQAPAGGANSGNFFDPITGYAVTGSTGYSSTQNYLTDAKAYSSAISPSGTYDQGGNVWEWNEALISGSYRGLRGGSWSSYAFYLQSSIRNYENPTTEGRSFGFRVATVPEPAALIYAASGMAIIFVALGRRRRRAP